MRLRSATAESLWNDSNGRAMKKRYKSKITFFVLDILKNPGFIQLQKRVSVSSKQGDETD